MTVNNYVVWADPGMKTGLAIWTAIPGSSCYRKPDVTEHLSLYDTGTYLLGTLPQLPRADAPPAVRLGWERFTIRPDTHKLTAAPWSLEVIGMLRWLCASNDWKILPDAAPSDRELGKKAWVDALGWCPRGMRDDGMSACQHLLAWMLRTGSAPAYVHDMIRNSQT